MTIQNLNVMYKVYFFTACQNVNSVLSVLSTDMLSVRLGSDIVLDDESTRLCDEFKWLSRSVFFNDQFRSLISDSSLYVVQSYWLHLDEILRIIFLSNEWKDLEISDSYTYFFVLDKDSNYITFERKL